MPVVKSHFNALLVPVQSSDSTLRTNDQYLSLTDQLNLGVRAVELDTHWVEVGSQNHLSPAALAGDMMLQEPICGS